MAQYALVDSNGIIQNIVEWDGAAAYTPPNGLTAVLTSTISSNPAVPAAIGNTWLNNTYTPVIVTVSYVGPAQAALAVSDRVASRCFKAGVAFPSAWLTYVQTLRAIVAGTQSGPLPAQPAYPAGT
jgi:hypothetical protein